MFASRESRLAAPPEAALANHGGPGNRSTEGEDVVMTFLSLPHSGGV
jgi:hypothetical protein